MTVPFHIPIDSEQEFLWPHTSSAFGVVSVWILVIIMGMQRASLVAQWQRILLLMQETGVQSPGEGNGSPPQDSCLENSMDRGAKAGSGPWGDKDLDTASRLKNNNSEHEVFMFF